MRSIEKDNIFGLKEAPDFSTDGLGLRYETEVGQEGAPDYLRQRVYCDGHGNYSIAVKGGMDATLGIETQYYLDGREVLIPTRPEALSVWAQSNLYGEDSERALEEFKTPDSFKYETVWAYQQGTHAGQEGYIHEVLWKTADGLYILFSTDDSYPAFGYNAPFIEFGEGGTSRDDLFIYYITPETARRWAEARGMDEETCHKVFGH